MKRKNLLGVILTFILTLIICTPAFTAPITKEDVEKSEEYLRKKAEIRFIKVEKEIIREVYINGFRVNDQNLASMSNDKALIDKIGTAISSRRATWGTTVGLGLPVGSLLIYLAASGGSNIPANNQPAPIGQFNRPPAVDAKTFVLGTLGTLVTLYAVVNSISLLNDLTGLSSPQILKDREAEDIVKKYNENLKNEILNKQLKVSFGGLSSSDNNIMILNVSKSF